MSILGEARNRLRQSGYSFPQSDPFGHYNQPNPGNTIVSAGANLAPGVTTSTPSVNAVANITPVSGTNPLVNRVSPNDDQRSYDLHHQPTDQNPLDVLRNIDVNEVRDNLITQFGDIGTGVNYLKDRYRSGGILGLLNATGQPITDAPWVQPGYAEQYLAPELAEIDSGDLRFGPGGGIITTGREPTLEDNQALIASGNHPYYDAQGNVRPAEERRARGITVQPGHYVEGSAAGGTSNVLTPDTLQGNYQQRVEEANTPVAPAPTWHNITSTEGNDTGIERSTSGQYRIGDEVFNSLGEAVTRINEINQADYQRRLGNAIANINNVPDAPVLNEPAPVQPVVDRIPIGPEGRDSIGGRAGESFSISGRDGSPISLSGRSRFNKGGYINQGGFPGEPRGTDTVPTWLTEGEFVVDKDSTEKFGPVLEQINSWEPDGGIEGFMSEMDDLINKVNGV